jgi:hypothetical protein
MYVNKIAEANIFHQYEGGGGHVFLFFNLGAKINKDIAYLLCFFFHIDKF